MKKIAIIVIFFCILLSCEKDLLIPKKEIPNWLIEAIEADEKILAEDETSMVGAGSWTRTEWNGEYYYEYTNMLSSSMANVRTHNGGTLDIYVGINIDIPYHLEKCCSKCVWKGPYGICID